MNQNTNEQDSAILATGRVAFSVAEAAIAVGLSQRTLWTNVRAGKIRVARVGTRVLILKSDLEAWLSGLADTSGARVRGDLAEPLAARNRARAGLKSSCAEKEISRNEQPPANQGIEKELERSFRRGYWDGFDEGSENVLSDHATRKEMNELYNKIMAWAQEDCGNYRDPPKLKRG